MGLQYLLFFTLSFAVAQVTVLPEPQSLEDFEHQHKGCPANSECDPVMALQLTRWQGLVNSLKSVTDDAKKAAELDAFRQKWGIPAEFYTTRSSQKGYRPLLFDSHCKEHNPKDPEKKILRGTAFVKELSSSRGVVWRDQAQIEVPVGDLLRPQPVTVSFAGGSRTYQLPLGDQPLFIRNKELFVLREYDDLFYMLKVGAGGDWKIVSFDFTDLSKWQDAREPATCPEGEKEKAPEVFGASFCKRILEEDSGKPVLVRMHLGCPT